MAGSSESPAEHGVDVCAIASTDGFEARADRVACEEVGPADFSREGEPTACVAPIEEAGKAQSAAVERGRGEGVEQVFLVGIEASGEPIRQEEGSEE